MHGLAALRRVRSDRIDEISSKVTLLALVLHAVAIRPPEERRLPDVSGGQENRCRELHFTEDRIRVCKVVAVAVVKVMINPRSGHGRPCCFTAAESSKEMTLVIVHEAGDREEGAGPDEIVIKGRRALRRAR